MGKLEYINNEFTAWSCGVSYSNSDLGSEMGSIGKVWTQQKKGEA